ncbi:MAG: glycosyltransferase [Bacteroidota bacterium]
MEGPRRIAIVHEWFTSMRGGEKCVEALCEMYPGAVLFALLHVPGAVSPVIEAMPIRTSFIQHLPFARTRYRHYLPLFPRAVERLDLRGFDLVLSSSHCVAKGARARGGALHICYCHTPMRYIWHHYREYFGPGRAALITRLGMAMAAGPLRKWDLRTASNPARYIANSENVRSRIRALYGRDAVVVHPPVDTDLFSAPPQAGEFFLVVSALVPYKRVDRAVRACAILGERLVVVGEGPELARLRSIAPGTARFAGRVGDAELARLYARSHALLFPGEEDFGIAPLEAMAAGKPVVALARGGATETVVDSPEGGTGILYRGEEAEDLALAIRGLGRRRFDPGALRAHARRFDRSVFKRRMREEITRIWAEERGASPQMQAGE